MVVVRIHEVDDPRLDDYRHLRDAELARASGGRAFVAESPLVVAHLLASGRPVRSVLVDERVHGRLGAALAGFAGPTYVVAPAVLASVVGFDLHRGALAVGERWEPPDAADLVAGARVVVVAERVNDHENLGVLLRTAAAFAVDAVLLCPECSDPLYRRSLRVSIGHALTLPWARAEGLPGGLGVLRAAGFTTVALTPERSAEPLRDLRPGRGDRVALLVGAEGPGLRPSVLAGADRRVRIPMAPGVDSLNVATALAVAVAHVTEAVRPLP